MQPEASSYLVPPAMLVAAIAMGVASHLHLGVTTDMAIAVGSALFCAMLLCHVLLRAADIADRAEEEAEELRVQQVSSPMPAVTEAAPFATDGATASTRSIEASEPARPTIPLVVVTDAVAAEFGRGMGALAEQDAHAAHAASGPQLADRDVRVGALPQETHVDTGLQAPGSASAIAARGLNPAGWSLRPADHFGGAGAATDGDAAPAVASGIGALRPSIVDQLAPREGADDADRIDQILKRLALQIRAESAADAAMTPEAADSPVVPTAASEAALANAVGALRSTVEAMRQGAPVGEPRQTAPLVTVDPAELRIAAAAEALAAERVDVVLEPILGLAEAEARHFEVSVRLRSCDGELIDARGCAGGATLLPLLDAISVRHAAGFALKLERRGRGGAVFSTVAGQSLESDGFVGDVAGRFAQGIADRMVLSFAQAELRGLGPAHFAALGDLSRLGFRFAMTGVADVDMDFDALKSLGFQFVKLDAAVFLDGLPCSGQRVPASDLCRFFAEMGIEVIVCGIDDQQRRDTLVGCGVTLGQGLLYGEPRPIPFASGAAAAAA